MFALLLAAALSLNPGQNGAKVFVVDKTEAEKATAIAMTQSVTVEATFDGVKMALEGKDAIKIHSQNSLLVFKNSELGALGDWNQYNGTDGDFNKSYIAVDGKLIVKPNGYTITLHRVKSATDKTAAIIVKGEGELILDNPRNVTVVRPEDLKGLAIQVKAKKEEE